jgi:hypothetical protein
MNAEGAEGTRRIVTAPIRRSIWSLLLLPLCTVEGAKTSLGAPGTSAQSGLILRMRRSSLGYCQFEVLQRAEVANHGGGPQDL